MKPSERREYIDAVRAIPAEHRAWLSSDSIDLFAYHGFGVVLNDAQLEACEALTRWPAGTIHLWRWANRTGKTTALVIFHLWAIWKKWRYVNEDEDARIAYLYRTLHSAPLNRLTGKAWELGDALIGGSAIQQRNPLTNRQRPALLSPFFTPKSGRTADGSEGLWIECASGGQIDFLSTHDGAARMESEAWWVISWDEFVRQAPVGDIPILFDQTFLPRSSDHMAPVILSGTVTEDVEPIYQELEDIATEAPQDWNVMTFGRDANFSQSEDSIDRQRRLSIDPAIAARSLDGGIGEGGRGTLFPHFVLKANFDPKLPTEYSDHELVGWRRRGYELISAFDHAATGDLNVVTTVAVPWPIPDGDEMLEMPIFGVDLAERRSGSHMTPTLQVAFACDVMRRMDSRYLIVDSTAEGGALVYHGLREMLPDQVIPCTFNAKLPGALDKNKQIGLQALQRMMSWGLDGIAFEEGWIDEWPDVVGRHFGLLRMPMAGRWLKLHRELAVLRRDDSKQRQDRAMTMVMIAWYLNKFIWRSTSAPQPFSIVGRKPRSTRRRRETFMGM